MAERVKRYFLKAKNVIKTFILLFIILIFCFCNEKKNLNKNEYEIKTNIIINQIIDERISFIKGELELYQDNNKITDKSEYSEYLMLEEGLIKEANSLIVSKKLNAFKLNNKISTSLSNYKKQIDESNKITIIIYNFFTENLFEKILEILIGFLILFIISFFATSVLKLELFKLIITNKYIIIGLFILFLIIRPAERLGIVSHNIIDSIIDSEREKLEQELNDIKEKNIEII